MVQNSARMFKEDINCPEKEKRLLAFRGLFQHKISGTNGRIHLPSDFKKALDNRGVSRLIVIKEAGHLRLWPEDEWEKEEAQFHKLSLNDKKVVSFLEEIYSNLESVEVDVQGRFIISEEMRRSAELKDQVLMLGIGRIIELWNPEGFKWKKREDLIPNFEQNREYVDAQLKSAQRSLDEEK